MSNKSKNISKLFLEEKKNLEVVDTKKDLETEKKDLEKKKIMKEIEIKTEKKILSIDTSIEKELQSVLSDSANEFKEKTGRHMTYSEMREMFG
jgi:ribosome-binding ATPase YchF (GTP1/OBG family)